MKVIAAFAAAVVLLSASAASAASVSAGIGALEPTVLAMVGVGAAGLFLRKRRD